MTWTLNCTHSQNAWDTTTELHTNGMTVDTWAEAEAWWECWSNARNTNRTVATMTDSNNNVVRVRFD